MRRGSCNLRGGVKRCRIECPAAGKARALSWVILHIHVLFNRNGIFLRSIRLALVSLARLLNLYPALGKRDV